ncbi:Elongation of fatty acids protein 3-like [Bienertia sinuspersici]
MLEHLSSLFFYLPCFLHLFRAFFSLLRHRKLPTHHLLNHSILIFSPFLWLEFSQSFQVLAIIFTTLVSSLVYGYRFWTAIGLPSACFPFVLNCQILLLSCNLICHIGILLMHFLKGGCNGIDAWSLNSVLNTAILLVFLCICIGFPLFFLCFCLIIVFVSSSIRAIVFVSSLFLFYYFCFCFLFNLHYGVCNSSSSE